MRESDAETMMEGVPPGATLAEARSEILPARAWVQTGMEGIEIYLDADESVRLLVRRVAEPELKR